MELKDIQGIEDASIACQAIGALLFFLATC